MGHNSLLQCYPTYSRGTTRVVLSSPTICPAVDTALSRCRISGLWRGTCCASTSCCWRIFGEGVVDAAKAYYEHRREMGVFM